MKKIFIAVLICLVLCCSLTIPVAAQIGCDSNTQLYLKLNGDDEATSTTDEDCDSSGAHAITFVGSAQLDTANPKFGSAALLLRGDANGDFLTVPDSTDFDLFSDTTDATIEVWVAHAAIGQSYGQHYLKHATDTSNAWIFRLQSTNDELNFAIRVSASTVLNLTSAQNIIADNNYHWVVLAKDNSTEYGIYLDGTQVAFVDDDSTGDFADLLCIGTQKCNASATSQVNGHIDNVQLSASNVHSANPNSGLSNTINVPTGEYPFTASTQKVVIITKANGKKYLKKTMVTGCYYFQKRKDSGYDRVIKNYCGTEGYNINKERIKDHEEKKKLFDSLVI